MTLDTYETEKELLNKKQLLLNQINEIDQEIQKLRTERDANIPLSPQEQTPFHKNRNNDDILSLLRNTDPDDDWGLNFTTFKNNSTSPSPTYNSQENVTLNETDKISILGVDFNKTNPQNTLIELCEVLISKAPYKVAYFTKDKLLNNINLVNFSFIETEINFDKHRLSNGMWVRINEDYNDIINISNKLLGICGYNNDNFKIKGET